MRTLEPTIIRDSRRRCLLVLLRIANCRFGDKATATADMRQELAAMANLLRKTAGRILRVLAETELLTVGYRSIALHDAAALRGMLAA